MSLSQQIATHLPLLRRYARSLAGTQTGGDAYVRATIEVIIQDPTQFPRDIDPRVALYRVFHAFWSKSQHWPAKMNDPRFSRFHERLDGLSSARRQALLLTAMEGFTKEEAGQILDRSPTDVSAMIAQALVELAPQIPVPVLIVEDEPLIALDIADIVEDMGHHVCAVASTHSQAVAAAKARPGLVLADIHLADDSSGIDAVKEILSEANVPVVFITGYPEFLLTGERPEPTFLVTKPFSAETVKVAIAQALLLGEEQGDAPIVQPRADKTVRGGALTH